MASDTSRTRPTKHRQVFESLHDAIRSGKYVAGQKLPSEATLIRQFDTSRITVGRALRDLQQQGYIERRAGSGTYVRAVPKRDGGFTFGLLIPELGQTEIFEPICQGMARAPPAGRHALLWGNAPQDPASLPAQAWQLCGQFIARKADGVFFAPLEFPLDSGPMNLRILDALRDAKIPVVLLDRDALPFPARSAHDLVGIDNRRAGFLIAAHLWKLGARRIAFVARPGSAPTVDARIAGYREALLAHEAPAAVEMVQHLDPADVDAVRRMRNRLRPDAVVCANDRTAGHLMHSLIATGARVPGDVRIAGIDDAGYAQLLPVPLTTIRQPCREIGEVAITAMLERVASPGLPAREILLDCKLIVRRSCGAKLAG